MPGRRYTPDEQATGMALAKQQRALRALQAADGTQLDQATAKLRALRAEVEDRLNEIPAEVAAAFASLGVYTVAEVDNLVANPPGDVHVAGAIFSPHGRANPVVNDYVSAWLNVDGRIGASASTRAVKRDLEPFPPELAEALLSVVPQLGRYVWDDPDSPLKVFLIAEDVKAAGFGPDVVPRDPEGEPFTINYSQLVVPLLAIVRDQQARIEALEAAVHGVQ